MVDPICSDQSFVYVIDEPGVDFWQWSVESGTVTGATEGSGGPGTVIINNLINTGDDVETVTYTFLGFAGGACPVFAKEVTVDVYPQIVVTLDPVVLCSTPTEPYELTPEVSGGTGNYEYLWAPGGENTATIQVPNPVNGTTYTVSVTDEIGCFSKAVMTISVYTTFPVDILAPVVEQCIQDGPLTIEATATGGMDPYAFEWTLPDGSNNTNEVIMGEQTGQYIVVVTDDEGCIGKDSVNLTLNETPAVYIDAIGGILALCAGQSTDLTGVATMGESPYIYEWDTPEGPESGKQLPLLHRVHIPLPLKIRMAVQQLLTSPLKSRKCLIRTWDRISRFAILMTSWMSR